MKRILKTIHKLSKVSTSVDASKNYASKHTSDKKFDNLQLTGYLFV